MTDTIVYGIVTGLLLLFIAWLLVVPAPGHDPLVSFMHSGLS